ncbi:MAG: IS21-like element helper ATPase IstB [Candidatus Baltobacteraceae bacterium]|jgi:DNA replication protein DnaC
MTIDPLRQRAKALKLYGLLAHWTEIDETSWLPTLVQWEEEEQIRRSLERRIKGARLGRFKALDQFDWNWPTRCDRGAIEAILTLEFIQEAANVILIGPNGVGKTMLAKNIAHQALIAGHTVLCTVAGQLLGDLTASESDAAVRRRLRQYSAPDVLVVDEIGYLSYSNRHADLLFELLNRRYEKKSTIITTNKPFAQWQEVFPSAGCVVSLVDRLVHRSEVIAIEGKSYRLKEAEERSERNQRRRRTPKAPK